MTDYCKIKEKGSTVKTEVSAGITNFMAMAYVFILNSSIFAELGVVSYNAIYIATAISAVIGTVLIGLLANLPLAQASGMGLNAFFVYTVCFGFGLTYANALILVLLDGIIFITLTVTGLRKKIFDSIPQSVKIAMPVGIGLFIAFLGFQKSGIVVSDSSTLVTLASFNMFNGQATWESVMPMSVTVLSIVVIAILAIKKVKGAILFGILGGTAAYYILGCTIPGFYDGFMSGVSLNPFSAFGEFADQALFKVFTEGFDFSAYLANNSVSSLIILIVTTALAFCLVDMFDTMATLYGACSQGNLLTEDGEVPNMNKAMLADAVATAVGAVCGTSTVTTYVEASAGIAEGGRTGLSALVTAGLFFIAMFLSPITMLVPSCATAAVLIYVGVLMMGNVKKIDWNDISVAVPAFMTIAVMPFTYNISYGIAFGFITHVFIKLFTGRAKEINVGTYIITALFIIMFLLTH